MAIMKVNKVCSKENNTSTKKYPAKITVRIINCNKKLLKATPIQRNNFKTNGIYVFWEEIDEIIGIKNVLFGMKLFL